LVVIVVAVGPSFIEHLLTEQPWVLFWIALILMLLGWGFFLFRMPTSCDVETKKGTPCDNNARGYFGACNQVRRHKDAKRRELAARIGFRAWANRARRMWTDRSSPPSPPIPLNQPAPGNNEDPGRLCRTPMKPSP
jgi:hypothetical protein